MIMLSVVWLVCSAVSLHTFCALASQVVLEDLMNAGGNAADAVGIYRLIEKSSS